MFPASSVSPVQPRSLVQRALQRAQQVTRTTDDSEVPAAALPIGDIRAQLGRTLRRVHRVAVLASRYLHGDEATGPLLGALPALDAWALDGNRGRVVRLPPVASLYVPGPNGTRTEVAFPAPYAVAMPGARLLGPEGHVIVDRHVALDVSPASGRGAGDHPALLRFRRSRPDLLDACALVMTGLTAVNHYHWLFDILPRYAVARDAGMKWDRVVTYAKTAVHRECLARLGIAPDSVVAPPWHGQLDIAEAIVPSIPSTLDSPSPYAVAFLRQMFAPEMGSAAGFQRKIYVLRARSAQRRIRNDAQVRRCLEDRGFVTIALEDLSLADQVRLFANADAIVAPHGAGLANLAFCRPETRVIELFASRYTPRYYEYLATMLGLDYAALVEGGCAHGQRSGHFAAEDMNVDIAALDCVLPAAS